MKIVMIKKMGCNPCKIFEPTIKSMAKQNQLEYKSVQAEDMPENMRPDVFPYFYLLVCRDMIFALVTVPVVLLIQNLWLY